MKFHLIANSHLDPVWLWDWREGLNEGITTCRTILTLMEEFPELTYIRGESAIYAHIQRHDPKTFEQIRRQIDRGRWEVVGGTYLQPDTNLPGTETLVRHYTRGLDYFQSVLGRRPTVAWAADSFGHSAGWPEIFAAAGMKAFAFSRPFEHDFHLPKPAFWWEARSGQRILSWRIPIGWYGSERDELPRRLDAFRKEADGWGLEHVPVFYGLGNHGGGPSRRQLRDIQKWADMNRDIKVEHSSLHRFFDLLAGEAKNLPVIKGELNFTLRGCYSSAARFKTTYRKTENLLHSAEKTSSLVAMALNTPPAELVPAWEALLFNTFHDILPGTSLERAFDDQFAWLGNAWHQAQRAELDALNALALKIDTRVPEPASDYPTAVPVLVWNPHPYEYDGYVELEAGLDYRPIQAYANRPDALPVELLDAAGRPLAFQSVAPENQFAPHLPWRKRLVTRVRLPAFGWQVLRMAWKEKPKLAAKTASKVKTRRGKIGNGLYEIKARPGAGKIDILHRGRSIFKTGGLEIASFEDIWGSWGGHDGERAAESISTGKKVWKIEAVDVIEAGPERAVLAVRLAGQASRLDLSFRLYRGTEQVEIVGRLFWAESGRRLKLLLPSESKAEFDVPGSVMKRGPQGEVPGGRWVKTSGFTFLSDAIYNFEMTAAGLNATLVRSAPYACSDRAKPSEKPWRPYMDLGEHRFRLLLAPPNADREPLSAQLEQPPVCLATAAHAGELRGKGALGKLSARHVRLLALKPAQDGRGFVVRVQETTGRPTSLQFQFQDKTIDLGAIKAFEIASWRLQKQGASWHATRVLADESLTSLHAL